MDRYLETYVVLCGVTVCCAVCGGCIVDAGPGADRVAAPLVGGTVAPGVHPAVGAIVYPRDEEPWVHCTATLIAPRAVVTAAHCVALAPEDTPLSFYYGDDLTAAVDASSQMVAVDAMVMHPDYNPDGAVPADLTAYRDIAVATLASAPPGITPFALPQAPGQPEHAPLVDMEVLLVGFGRTALAEPTSAGQRQIGASLVQGVATYEFKIYRSDGAQKCLGDSGSPTLHNFGSAEVPDWRILGVSSRTSDGCVGGSVETRVDAYLSWIHDLVDVPCGSGLSPACPLTTDTPEATRDAAITDTTTADASAADATADANAPVDASNDATDSVPTPSTNNGCALAPTHNLSCLFILMLLGITRATRLRRK